MTELFRNVQFCTAFKKQHFQFQIWYVSYKERYKLKIRVKHLQFSLEKSCSINELLRYKLYDGDTKHTFLFVFVNFDFQEKL